MGMVGSFTTISIPRLMNGHRKMKKSCFYGEKVGDFDKALALCRTLLFANSADNER